MAGGVVWSGGNEVWEGREREVSTQVFGFQLLQPMIVKVQ